MNYIEKFKDENSHCLRDRIYYLTPLKADSPENFEELYLKMRTIEGRVYNDETVRNLPEIDKDHPNYKEWNTRKNSSEKLIKYLSGIQKELNILELGCGNGWLSAKIAGVKSANVIAVDINNSELEQAARIFGHIENLEFVYADIFDSELNVKLNLKFDITILAGVLMYFKDVNELIDKLLGMLNPKGEIHIIDNVFYNNSNVEDARRKTLKHYKHIGMPDMFKYVHHHLLNELDKYNPKILYNPKTISGKINRKFFYRHLSPFIWMKIVNN